MRYQGGKYRIAKRIAHIINVERRDRPIWDPFCGGLSVAHALGGDRIVSDVHPALIAMYKAVAAGWRPPTTVTREQWDSARSLPDTDPMKAFAGFGCSFGGIYFGSYAKCTGPRVVANGASKGRTVLDDYPAASAKSICAAVAGIVASGSIIECIDFIGVEPFDFGGVLYLDPPYRGTLGYSRPFDHDAFDRRVLEWARVCPVFVSEYALPYGSVVGEFVCTSRGLGPAGRIERLYRVGGAP